MEGVERNEAEKSEQEKDFLKRSLLDQSTVEKEVGGDEELTSGIPYETNAGEGAETVMDRELRADGPADERGYRRLDEPSK